MDGECASASERSGFDKILTGIGTWLDEAKEAASGWTAAVKYPIWLAEQVWGFLTGVGEYISETIKGLWELLNNLGMLMDLFKAIVNDFWGFIQSMGGALLDPIIDKFAEGKIAEGLGYMVGLIVDLVVDPVGKLAKFITASVSGAATLMSKMQITDAGDAVKLLKNDFPMGQIDELTDAQKMDMAMIPVATRKALKEKGLTAKQIVILSEKNIDLDRLAKNFDSFDSVVDDLAGGVIVRGTRHGMLTEVRYTTKIFDGIHEGVVVSGKKGEQAMDDYARIQKGYAPVVDNLASHPNARGIDGIYMDGTTYVFIEAKQTANVGNYGQKLGKNKVLPDQMTDDWLLHHVETLLDKGDITPAQYNAMKSQINNGIAKKEVVIYKAGGASENTISPAFASDVKNLGVDEVIIINSI